MTLYGLYRSFWLIITLALISVGGTWACIHVTRIELAREASFRTQYGDQWQAEYEQNFGSLTQAHFRVGLGFAGVAGIFGASVWLVMVVKKGILGENNPRRKHKPREESRIERRVRYKRNALLGVYFGVPGILLSVLLTIFRWGIFADHSSEVTLAIFVFIGSYCAVISGCSWWAKAKGWSEAVVTIGFGPLFVFFIPFVRLLVFQVPGLLVAAMVMAPLILVVVVAALPDKSGHSRRLAEWEKRK
jgi:hypothetical protein